MSGHDSRSEDVLVLGLGLGLGIDLAFVLESLESIMRQSMAKVREQRPLTQS